MIAVDSSVVVAAFASWHELHERALDVLARGPLIPVQAALETYSVLTRLPPPFRVAPEPVVEFLIVRFGSTWPALDAPAAASLLSELCELRIVGGTTYDAAIAVTAREHGATLVSCDVRASRSYEELGVSTELLA